MSLDQLIENDSLVREITYLQHSLDEQEKLGLPLNRRIEIYTDLRGQIMNKYNINHYGEYEALAIAVLNDIDPLYNKNG